MTLVSFVSCRRRAVLRSRSPRRRKDITSKVAPCNADPPVPSSREDSRPPSSDSDCSSRRPRVAKPEWRPRLGSVILCVDMQEAWIGEGSDVLEQFPEFKSSVQRVYSAARQTKLPLVHIRAKYTKDASLWVPFFKGLNPDKPAYSVQLTSPDYAKELLGETVVLNSSFDAFHETQLHSLLKSVQVKHVYVCGYMTSGSVLMTMHGAFSRGYGVTMIEDACADRSQDRQASVLSLYKAQYFSSVTSYGLTGILSPASPKAPVKPRGGAVVLCVDLQESWVGQESPILQEFPEFIPAVERVFLVARACGLPLIHIRANYTREDSPWVPFFKDLNPEKPAYEVSATPACFAEEHDGEIVVPKPTYDAFRGTDLHDILERSGVEQVYVLGTVTSACVLMTMHGAFARGYRVSMVEDACADRTRERQNAMLLLYKNQYFTCITSSDLALSCAS